jgi:hypothetical protein
VIIQPLIESRIGKYFFDPALGIIKISNHSCNIYIIPFLGGHLPLLHFAYAVLGIENHDPGSRHILKSCQGSFAVSPDVATRITISRFSWFLAALMVIK